MSYVPTCWGSKPFPSTATTWHSWQLLKTFCNLNAHISLWLHRHIQGLGGMINTWTNQETPGVLLGYHYGSTSLYTSCLDQNKAVHFGDLIRLALPHIFTVALSHCLHFVSVKELGQTDRERFVFGCFFVRTFLVCSHWSAALGDSCCDCGAQLNLKLLI